MNSPFLDGARVAVCAGALGLLSACGGSSTGAGPSTAPPATSGAPGAVAATPAMTTGAGGAASSRAPALVAQAPEELEPVLDLKGDGPAAPETPTIVVPPVVSIGDDAPHDPEASADAPAAGEPDPGELAAEPEPAEGSPEWLLREVTRLYNSPVDVIRQPIPGKPGEFEEVELTDEQADQEEQRRARKIVDLAVEVCARTKDDASKETVFNNAVHYLAQSRVILALAGDAEQAQVLARESETLFRRAPTSFAAIEANTRLLELALELAETRGESNPEWTKAAARQARLFTERFPGEANRAAIALLSAARVCEAHDNYDEARRCFLQLAADFADTPFAEQAAGAIRRYRLQGQPLVEFAGDTVDGGFVSIDQFAGRPVLIVFFTSDAPQFQDELPRLKKLMADGGPDACTLLSVSLDAEEAMLDKFLEHAELPGSVMFSAEIERRGLRHPLARFYGVATTPQYWLVDAEGQVVQAPATLDAVARELLKRVR